jgi:hypothetical protein
MLRRVLCSWSVKPSAAALDLTNCGSPEIRSASRSHLAFAQVCENMETVSTAPRRLSGIGEGRRCLRRWHVPLLRWLS